METQFEVKTNLEFKHWVEYYHLIWSKRLWTVAIFVTIGVFCLLAELWTENFSGWLYFLWFVLYSVWLYFRPWIVARKAMKQERKFEGQEDLCSVTKFSDVIHDESKHQTAEIPYDKVESIHIGKNVIVLIDVRKLAIIVDKNGFVKGSFEDFLPFIQEKCPQLNLPKW